MVYLCWLLVVMMAYVCVPGFGSVCWESSVCNNLSDKESILPTRTRNPSQAQKNETSTEQTQLNTATIDLEDCIDLCMSVIQNEFPQLSALALKVNDEELLLNIILATLMSEDKLSESDLKAHSDLRRSYSMEHFRWGKPSGRKRRPVKVFASSLEGGGSSEGSFLPLTRRQLSSYEEEVKGEPNGGSKKQGSQRARGSSKSHVPLSTQGRKDATYRMSHFRWGSPPASKRNGRFLKPWKAKPQGQLSSSSLTL